MIDYSLYLVTDDPSRYRGNWLDNVVAAVAGGVTCVQYRDTESSRKVQFERINALKDALKSGSVPTKSGSVPIIINNDAELAAAVGAQGVHVGQNDMPVEEVRKIVGPECEIGLSITEVGQLERVGQPVNCLGIGPVFDARKTKADASEAMGVDGLNRIMAEIGRWRGDIATVAIGGITLENAAEVLATGVGGLAVVSAFSKAENPEEVAREMCLELGA